MIRYVRLIQIGVSYLKPESALPSTATSATCHEHPSGNGKHLFPGRSVNKLMLLMAIIQPGIIRMSSLPAAHQHVLYADHSRKGPSENGRHIEMCVVVAALICTTTHTVS